MGKIVFFVLNPKLTYKVGYYGNKYELILKKIQYHYSISQILFLINWNKLRTNTIKYYHNNLTYMFINYEVLSCMYKGFNHEFLYEF